MKKYLLPLATAFAIALTGCSGSDSDNSAATQQSAFTLFNASPNMPSIYPVVKEAKDNGDDLSLPRLSFGNISSLYKQSAGSYKTELNWRKGAAEFDTLASADMVVQDHNLSLMLLTDDGKELHTNLYSIPYFSDDELKAEKSAAISLINAHRSQDFDIYYSASDKDFDSAEYMEGLTFKHLSKNVKLATGKYIFYFTKKGAKELLLKTSALNLQYHNQYLIVARESKNEAHGSLTADFIFKGKINSTEVQTKIAETSYINAIHNADLVNGFSGELRVTLDGAAAQSSSQHILPGAQSPNLSLVAGDYRRSLSDEASQEDIVTNELTEMLAGTSTSQLFYLDTAKIDANGNSLADKLQAALKVMSLPRSLENNNREHPIRFANVANLAEFPQIQLVFVRQDETISSSPNKVTAQFANHRDIVLNNDKYEVFALAKNKDRQFVVANANLDLTAQSSEVIVILYDDVSEPNGVGMKFYSVAKSSN